MRDSDLLGSLPRRFEAQVRRYGSRLAVSDADRSWTYAQLNTAANGVASEILRVRGERSEPVALLLNHGAGAIVAVLGVLKAGKFYLPLNPTDPDARIAGIVQESGSRLLLADHGNLSRAISVGAECAEVLNTEEIPKGDRNSPLDLDLPGDSLAYVMYTSGSTGTPKGVMQTHTNVLHYIADYSEQFAICCHDRISALAAIGFSASVADLFNALLHGACLFPFDIREKGCGRLASWLSQHEITVLNCTPVVFRALVNEISDDRVLDDLRLLILGGDRVYRADVDACRRHLPKGCRAWVGLGTTETGPLRHFFVDPRARDPEGAVPVGYPARGKEVWVQDERGRRVPPGEIGEITVRSRYLSPGYWRREGLTQAAFESGADDREGTIYRTGDLGRVDPDGCLYIAERKDFQVKVRGNRVEIGEVEAALLAIGDVEAAVVSKHPDGIDALVAWIVLTPDGRLSPSRFRHTLAEMLPDHMIPSAFVDLPEIPVTANGKVDRLALPAPDSARPALDNSHCPPTTERESALASIWEEVLHLSGLGVHDDFLELGGHSLLASEIAARAGDAFNVDVSLASFFANPTIAGFLKNLDAEATEAVARRPPISPKARDTTLPLSYMQQRLWFLEQLEPESAAYQLSAAVRLTGPLQLPALQHGLDALVSRHEILRTTFVSRDGSPAQVIGEARPVPVWVEDMPTHSERDIQRRVDAACGRRIDIREGPLLRATVLRISQGSHVLILHTHHIATDAWSMGVVFKELSELYNAHREGRESRLPELPLQYADYTLWQREWLTNAVMEQQVEYWKRQLEGAPPVLEIPTDRPRPSIQTHRGATLHRRLQVNLVDELRRLAAARGCTVFNVLLTAFQLLLSRYSGEKDIVVGCPVAGRIRPEIAGLIGFFVNTLPLRVVVEPELSFGQLLSKVKRLTIDALSHQDPPFDKLVEALRPERSRSHSPLVQVMFSLNNVPRSQLRLGGLEAHPMRVGEHTAKFDLSVEMDESNGGLDVYWEYNTDLFDAETIERMAGHFHVLLNGAIDSPDRRVGKLPLLTVDERQHWLVDWNNTDADYPEESCIHELFEEQVERTPHAVALVCEGQEVTYRWLNARANQLAHHLRSLGVGPGVVVGICLERSFELVIGLLGVLKSGGAYLPLDPSHPEERLAVMLKDADVSTLLSQSRFAGRFSPGPAVIELDTDWAQISPHSAANPSKTANSTDPAYVIYTSGSTGRPNGVLGVHRGTVNRMSWMWGAYPYEAGERCCQKTTLSFVDSVCEVFSPLLQGVALVLIPDGATRDIPAFVRLLSAHRVTRLVLVPSLLSVILRLDDELLDGLTCLKYWVTSGEELDLELEQDFKEHFPDAILLNLYGSSEVSADVTCFDTRERGERSGSLIGRPIANIRAYVLDDQLNALPVGVPGSLYIGGAGLAAGYLRRPELTEERFIPDPFSSDRKARLFDTGDVARLSADGELEFLGRRDHQIKIRGFRVELGEVESALEQHALVQEAVVLLHERDLGEGRLVAYLVPDHRELPSPVELREFLSKKLPTYMVPSVFAPLEVMPLTPGGKLDRRALAAREQVPHGPEETYVAPRTKVEEQLAEIWATGLWLERPVGIHDDFFDLGGHSLLSVRLVAEIEKAFGRQLPVSAFFHLSTIAELAKLLEDDRAGTGEVAEEESGESQLEAELHHRLLAYTAGWRGKRVGPDALMVGLNTEGTLRPLFWCLQGFEELSQLSRQMGEERPTYGMRSGHLTMSSTPENVEALAAHYLEELRMVQPEGPYLLGGNCQAADIAMAIAQGLHQKGERVALLCLLERFVARSYSGRVALFFGLESEFNPYRSIREPEVEWRNFYRPGGFSVDLVSGEHGQFFREPHIRTLGEKLRLRIAEISAGTDPTEKGRVR